MLLVVAILRLWECLTVLCRHVFCYLCAAICHLPNIVIGQVGSEVIPDHTLIQYKVISAKCGQMMTVEHY